MADEKIVIIGHKYIGDTILTEPIVSYLVYLGTDVELIVFSEAAQYCASKFRFPPDKILLIKSKISLLKHFRKVKYSSALLLERAFFPALVTFLARVKVRFGLNTEGRGIFLTNSLSISHNVKHHFEYHKILLRYFLIHNNLNLRAEYIYKQLSFPHLKIPAPAENSNDWIYIHGDSSRESKNLTLEVIKSILNRIRSLPFRILLVSKVAYTNRHELQESKSLLVIKKHANLDDLMISVMECRYLITVDTGPMHMAAALGKPITAIFTSTNPAFTGPLSTNSLIIQNMISCSPCYRSTCKYSTDSPQYMGCLEISKEILPTETISSIRQ